MVYHNQNYWVFGLAPLSGSLGTRKREVSETGSVSVLRCRGKTHTQLGPSCFLVPTIPDNRKSAKTK
jgi:hypothetical protein